MARITYLDPATVHGRTRELLAAAAALPGASQSTIRAMAGTAVLEGYLGLSTALARGSVTPAIADRIAVAVAEGGECDEGPPADPGAAAPHGSLDIAETLRARSFQSIEPRANAALRFARVVLDGHGHVDPEELRAARAADLTDVELVEIVGHVALNLLISYFNRAFAIDREVLALTPPARG